MLPESHSVRRVGLSFLALALVATWPAIGHPAGTVIGDGQSDMWKHLWGYWWFGNALFVEKEIPLFCSLLNYPQGGYLYFADPLTALMSLPLQGILGLVVSYNLIIVLQLVGGCLAAWLLARDLGLEGPPAVLSGVVYGLSPYALSYCVGSGVSETANLAWLPLYVLFLLRVLRGGTTSDAVAGGVFLFLTAFSCWYYAEFALVLTALVLIFGGEARFSDLPLTRRFRFSQRFGPLAVLLQAVRSQDHALRLRRVGPVALVALALTFPAASTFWQVIHNPFNIVMPAHAPVRSQETYTSYLGDGWWSVDQHGNRGHFNFATLSGFFRPGKGNAVVTLSIDRLTRVCYLGFLVLGLAATGLLLAAPGRRWALAFWGGTTAFFLFMSLGPRIYLYPDPSSPSIGSWPYLAVYHTFPLFKQVAHPFRMLVVAHLGLALLAGFGLARLRERFPAGPTALFWAASGLVLLETLLVSPTPFPMPVASARVPGIYSVIQEIDGRGAVWDFPSERPGTMLVPSEYYYYQTVHGKPIPYRTSGVLSEALVQNKLHQALNTMVRGDGNTEMLPELIREGARQLRDLQVQFLILHRDILGESLTAQVQKRLRDEMGPPTFQDGSIVLYRIY